MQDGLNGSGARVVRLALRERASLDPRAMRRLARHRDPGATETIIRTTLSELGRHLRRLDDDYRTGENLRLAGRARQVIVLCDQIGLRDVARVAADVARCSLSGDETALGATLARLMRLLSQALDEAAVDWSEGC